MGKVVRATESAFDGDPLFDDGYVRQKLEAQIKDKVKNYKRKANADQETKEEKARRHIKYAADLMEFKKQHTFHVPQWHEPQVVSSEIHMGSTAPIILLQKRG